MPATTSPTPTSSTSYPTGTGGFPVLASNAVSTAGAGTITTAQLINAIYKRDCAGSDRTDTTPTGAAIVAALASPVAGTSFQFIVQNTSVLNENLTIAAGDGNVTLSGVAIVGPGAVREFVGLVLDPVATTVRLQSVVSGTY